METMAEWLRSIDDLAGWAQAVATLLTGGLAIYAAKLALRGARKQADAVLETQPLQQALEKVAIACGLQAEALETHARYTANLHALRMAKRTELFDQIFIRSDLSFYLASQGRVGPFKPQQTWAVMAVFKRAVHFQADVAQLMAKSLRLDQVSNIAGLMKNMDLLVQDMKAICLGLSELTGTSRNEVLARISKIEALGSSTFGGD